jgi:hypothetical protein
MTESTCTAEGCDSPTVARGLCRKHYNREWRAGSLAKPSRPGLCTIEECGQPARIRGWCTKHYQRRQAHGDPLWEPAGRDPSRYDSTGHRLHLKVCPGCGSEFQGRTDQVNCSIGCASSGKKRPPGAIRHGEANHFWRGDDVGYHGLHIRVRKARGRADRCERCGATDPALNYDWASLVDNPETVDDFAPMCRSCHRTYDSERDHQRPGWQGANSRKLTADIVRHARREHAEGASFTELANRYGVSQVCMSRAVRGLTWAWLT